MVRSIFALAAVLSVASASLAGDLVTPSLYVGYSTSASCELVNITSAPIPAQVQLINGSGNVLRDSGSITVGAGASFNVDFNYPSDLVHCRFVNVSKSKVRADLTAFVGGVDDLTLM